MATQVAEKQPQQQFLFLPSATKFSTKPDNNLRRAINRHVQRHYTKRRRTESPIDSSAGSRRKQNVTPPVREISLAVDRQQVPNEAVDEIVRQTSSIATSTALVKATSRPRPQTYLDTSRMDPFSTSAVSLNETTAPIYNYYFSIIMPTVEPVHQEREEYNSWLFPLTLKEPALLYALLACMAYDLEEVSSNGFGPGRKRDMLDQRVQYKVWAIQALNRCLADPTVAMEASTLIAVHFLLWQEMFTDEDCIHIDGVKRLLEIRGGFKGIQRKAIEAIMIGNTWRAIRTRSRPILPKVLDDLPMSDERFEEILAISDPCVAKTSSTILSPSMRSRFGPEFWKLLQDARKVWICFEQIGTIPFPPLEKRHISIKRVNIDHRLLSYLLDHPDDSLCLPHHSATTYAASAIQEPLRLALTLYSSAHYNVVQPSSKVARALIMDLKEALEGSGHMRRLWCADADIDANGGGGGYSAEDGGGGGGGQPSGHAQELRNQGQEDDNSWQILLWVLFLGAHMSFGQVERSWFVAGMCKIRSVKMMGGSGPQQGGTVAARGRIVGVGVGGGGGGGVIGGSVYAARRALMGCYWSDRVFMGSLKRVWCEVETLGGLLAVY